jgi:hypothetical protein
MKGKFFIYLLLIINISFINNSYSFINKKSSTKTTGKSITKSTPIKLTQKHNCQKNLNRTESCLVVDMENGKIISSKNRIKLKKYTKNPINYTEKHIKNKN